MNEIISNLERQCHELALPILNRMGRNIVRKMNKQMETSNTIIDDDMAGLGMRFFDQLSIYYQSRTYEEIMFGFDDYLEDIIQAEIDELSEIDRLILEHRSFYDLSQGTAEKHIFADVKNEVSSIIDQHYYTKRVQHFVVKYDLNC